MLLTHSLCFNMAGSMLFDLPSDISVTVLNDWLPLKSVVALDTACCSQQTHRDWLLGLLQSPGFSICVSTSSMDFAAYSAWIRSRGVKIGALDVHPNLVHHLLNHHFPLQHVQRMACDSIWQAYPKDLAQLLDSCPLLLAVDLSSWDEVTDGDLDIFALANLPNIQSLKIPDSGEISHDGLHAVLSAFHDTLQELDLGGGGMTDDTLSVLMTCKQLKTVNICCSKDITGDALVSCFQQLHELKRLCVYDGSALLSDAQAIAMVSQCPLLEDLQFEECAGLTLASVLPVLSAHPRLLCFRHPIVGYRLLQGQGQGCEMSTCDDTDSPEDLLNVLVPFPSAPVTQLVLNYSIPEEVFAGMVDRLGDRLTLLSMPMAEEMGDDTVCHLAARCLVLVDLELTGCAALTDRSLLALTQGCRLLKEVGLRGADHLSDAAIAQCAAAGMTVLV